MKYQPNQSIVDYNDWDLATSSVITGDFTTDSLKYGFGPTSLSAEDWLPEGNWVDLGYDNAPTEDQLRSQIEAGEHNDAYGDLGCPDCGNVDLFWKTHSSKGQRYRCLSCEYSSNWETVKSQGDLTLQKFGLTVDCPLCSETISAYNRASIDSHFRKHKKEEAEAAEAAEASEPKVSESEWQEEVEWNDKPKKKTEPEWEDVEWEAEAPEQPRKCCECSTTEGLTTIQAGTFCWDCLPINLGAESSQEIKEYITSIHDGDFLWRDGWDNLEFTLQTLPMEIFEEYKDTDNVDGAWEDSPVNSHRLEDTLSQFRWEGDRYPPVVLKLDKNGYYDIIDGYHRLNALQILDYDTVEAWVGIPASTFEAEDDYWAGSVAKAIVNEMGDDYYFNEDLHEYNCVHFAQEMSEYLTQDGIPHEIQSFAGYGGEVAHAWVYVPSEGEYYDAWTPYGVSDWKDLDFWETVDYTPEWLEQQTPESFEAEDDYDAKNQEYVDDLLSKYPNIPVVHAKTIHDITDTDTIYRIDFPLTMYRATSSRTGTEKIGEIGYLQGTNKNYGMYFDAHFNDGEQMKESDFATVPVRKVYGALTMGAPMKQYLPKDAGELLAIDLEGYYIISVRGDFWSRYSNKINEHAVPAVLGDVQAEDVLMLFEPTMLSAEDNYDSTYGKAQAKIRRKLKNKIKQQAIMGTKAGQWSARKSQELKRQYETACQKKGLQPYKGSKTKKQQDLSDWSKQKWKTASGKKSSITGEPYFPAKAVAALKQKNLYAKAKRQKAAATKAGKQNARYSDDIRAVVKQFRAEESGSPTSTQLLNWITQPKTITTAPDGKATEKPKNFDWESEPTRCVWCSSADINSMTPEHQEEGLIYSHVGCNDCSCIWREEYRYVENEIIQAGEKRTLKSEDEQLSIEIEDIDETYGLIPSDPEMLSWAESAVSQYLSRTDLPKTFQLHTNPHFVFVSADAFGRSSHLARFRSHTSSHIPIIMLCSEAIRQSADDYGVSLKTAVETTVWHELGHVLCELWWDVEGIYPFESSNDEEEFAESIAKSMFFQESFQNPVV